MESSLLKPTLTLEVSNDGKYFEKCKNLEIPSSISNEYSLTAYIMHDLLFICWNSNDKSIYKYFRIHVQFQDISYFIANLSFVEIMRSYPNAYNSWDEKEKLESLTKSEKKILYFLYKEHSTKYLLSLFNIKRNTFKSHCKNIYSKMNFNSRKDLIKWCDKYYSDFTTIL